MEQFPKANPPRSPHLKNCLDGGYHRVLQHLRLGSYCNFEHPDSCSSKNSQLYLSCQPAVSECLVFFVRHKSSCTTFLGNCYSQQHAVTEQPSRSRSASSTTVYLWNYHRLSSRVYCLPSDLCEKFIAHFREENEQSEQFILPYVACRGSLEQLQNFKTVNSFQTELETKCLKKQLL